MKKSELREIIREEVEISLKDGNYGREVSNNSRPNDKRLNNSELMFDRMNDIDSQQLVWNIMDHAESNPDVSLVDYLNDTYGYDYEY